MNAAPPAGALLDGRYRLGAMIARGGMSTVHRGTDTRLDRPVAIKVMDPRLAGDPAFRTRFEREARSAARIDHPAVVDVHDQGADPPDGPESVLFLVMELVEGCTLRDVLRARGGLGVPTAFTVLEHVLAGLAQAHGLGLVHRDVKPENVLIGRGGEVKVADFGLVTASAAAGASHAGMILGTVAYLSPEQVVTGAADARSDVYAAGIVLYEMLTGAPPYVGDTAISVAYRHVNSAVPAPSLIAGDVPPELDALVARATDRDPAARFADANAMLAALQELRVLLGVPHVRIPVPAAAAPPPRRTATLVAPRPDTDGPVPAGDRATPHRHRPTGVLPATPSGGRSRRVLAAWIAVVAVLGVLVASVAWWLGTGRWTVTPSVVGLERAAAERLLGEADLSVTVATALSDDVPAGIVSAVDPAAESEVLRGSTVQLTVSAGRPAVPPIAAGTAVDEAERIVREAGLTPVRREADRHDPAHPVGAVLRTNPAAGTVLPVGAEVALVRNVEKNSVTVPFLIGRDEDDALDELEDLGLEGEVYSRLPFGFDGGRVVTQDPRPGSEVEPGSTVELGTL
ncbi:Stk1 family PASTA domain-containing Ser/Thr kinase [Pseudonocardia sp.]|uniref:Stk1 family PASTA domain-containing Ser/Thr kinase n=1 Tax=Pseudonocardia sp. TaxID=60912 RepID=UPI003D0EC1CC